MSNTIYPILFIDLETTGHDALRREEICNYGGQLVYTLSPWHEIIDFGAVLAHPKSLEVVEEFSMKVRPKHPERCLPNIINHYPERAKRGEWNNARSLEEVIRTFLSWCACQRQKFGSTDSVQFIPAGQNFFFDWNFLTVAFAQYGIDEKEWRKYLHYTRLDTRSMAVQEILGPEETYDPNEFSLRNNRLQERLGLEPEPVPHIALTGARQSHALYKKLRELASVAQARKEE